MLNSELAEMLSLHSSSSRSLFHSDFILGSSFPHSLILSLRSISASTLSPSIPLPLRLVPLPPPNISVFSLVSLLSHRTLLIPLSFVLIVLISFFNLFVLYFLSRSPRGSFSLSLLFICSRFFLFLFSNIFLYLSYFVSLTLSSSLYFFSLPRSTLTSLVRFIFCSSTHQSSFSLCLVLSLSIVPLSGHNWRYRLRSAVAALSFSSPRSLSIFSSSSLSPLVFSPLHISVISLRSNPYPLSLHFFSSLRSSLSFSLFSPASLSQSPLLSPLSISPSSSSSPPPFSLFVFLISADWVSSVVYCVISLLFLFSPTISPSLALLSTLFIFLLHLFLSPSALSKVSSLSLLSSSISSVINRRLSLSLFSLVIFVDLSISLRSF
ncbi:hypothetical protein C7M84_025166 [Penaeus vannamei]|uniref:Uncharacterized protein n=1 Tax=Penaeus vannamei TaxID=6689 RepID=A0A3R7MG22_PENVA|nr:hypothetical protein C7M84_025166 [Penaeus vannamei]